MALAVVFEALSVWAYLVYIRSLVAGDGNSRVGMRGQPRWGRVFCRHDVYLCVEGCFGAGVTWRGRRYTPAGMKKPK